MATTISVGFAHAGWNNPVSARTGMTEENDNESPTRRAERRGAMEVRSSRGSREPRTTHSAKDRAMNHPLRPGAPSFRPRWAGQTDQSPRGPASRGTTSDLVEPDISTWQKPGHLYLALTKTGYAARADKPRFFGLPLAPTGSKT